MECRARMININLGHNQELMESCKRLWDYSYFITEVNQNLDKGYALEAAIKKAMDVCIEKGVLLDILEKSRNEVFDMLLTEYDEKLHMKTLYEQGQENGRDAERERMNLQYKLTRAGLNDRARIKEQIDGLTEIIDHNEFMLSHKRCGYVYVVSNNDMKEGQYKIGITRRTVEERMKELGSGASHSFPMNVHGYVYCDDCFQVESAIHRHFADRRVNQVNAKKEWFYASLREIAQGFKDVCNIDIELVDAVDESYLYSQERLNA